MPTARDLLSDPRLRADLTRLVRRRVPESDVDDIVQAALVEALAGKAPEEPELLRRWIFGVVKHKVADFYRRARRERPGGDVADTAADSSPGRARELLDWASKELPDQEEAGQTLEWMLREGEGEKLQTIALQEKVPAPRVRQRVSRLRRHYRARWAARIAALAALGVVAFLFVWLLRRKKHEDVIVREAPAPSASTPGPLQKKAEADRALAFEACDHQRWHECVRLLDEAAALDPAGDTAPAVTRARERAQRALTPAPPPSVAPTHAPTPTPTVRPSAIPTAVPTPASTLPPPSPAAS